MDFFVKLMKVGSYFFRKMFIYIIVYEYFRVYRFLIFFYFRLRIFFLESCSSYFFFFRSFFEGLIFWMVGMECLFDIVRSIFCFDIFFICRIEFQCQLRCWEIQGGREVILGFVLALDDWDFLLLIFFCLSEVVLLRFQK